MSLQRLEDDANTFLTNLKTIIKAGVSDKLDVAIQKASSKAIYIAKTWSRAPREGGMHWAAYRTVCRHGGVNSRLQVNFNADLARPFISYLGDGWTKAFNKQFPKLVAQFTRDAVRELEVFHSDVTKAVKKGEPGFHGLESLNQQMQTHQASLTDSLKLVSSNTMEVSRKISRLPSLVVAEEMGPAYTACASEKGEHSCL
jgi:hypothetical protein